MPIPTKYRSKLSKDLSYPLGAEIISEAFAGVPQFESLSLSFSPYGSIFSSGVEKTRRHIEPYKIFEVEMHHHLKGLTSPNRFIEEGFYDENWEIHVYPVPAELKSAAKRLLLDKGLPQAKQWCEKPRTETWKTGRKCFQVLFDEKECEILIEQD